MSERKAAPVVECPTADDNPRRMNAANRSERARIAALTRHHPNDPETLKASRRFRAERYTEHVRQVLDSVPPMSASQKARLTALLRGAVR